MERLSIASFLASGHEYHLYVYQTISNPPPGVVLMAADEILPESMIFQYKNYPSYAGFANFFRYKLLLEKGGWWVDTDFVCLKPFVFEDPYVFASERSGGSAIPTNSVIRAPAGSELMAFNWRQCLSCPDPSGARWGEYGPRLMAAAITKFQLQRFVKGPNVFCPIAFDQWSAVLRRADLSPFGEETYSVHLWNEMWRRDLRDKNATYAPDCLYERFKSAFLPRSSRGLWGLVGSRWTERLWRLRRRCMTRSRRA
jgi:Glycosyltransferase sugar-binding region containing DXD motif